MVCWSQLVSEFDIQKFLQAQCQTIESLDFAAEKGIYTTEIGKCAVLGPFSFFGDQQQTALIIPTIYHVKHQNGEFIENISST